MWDVWLSLVPDSSAMSAARNDGESGIDEDREQTLMVVVGATGAGSYEDDGQLTLLTSPVRY